MALSTGQITIIDYNDALSLSSFISCNISKTQMYNPENGSYTPDWSTSPFCVLSAELYILGTGTNIITQAKSVKYYELVDGTETEVVADTNHVFSGTKNQILTIKVNELASTSSKDYICRIVYTDPNTELDLTQQCSISFSKVTNGSGLVDAVAWAPNGNIFKNNAVDSLTATIELWRGSTIDTTNVAYQWYIKDASVTTDQGGGVGWRKLTNTANKWQGVTTATITIYPAAFTNLGVFKASIKDTDATSSTHNQFFWDTITFIDNTDPIAINITSTGGNIFKNGIGSTTLTARVYQAGTEIDSGGTLYVYKWYKYNKDGNLVTGWGGSSVDYKTGKTLSLTHTDVDVKATFMVEIENAS